jgi:hypothetical protein
MFELETVFVCNVILFGFCNSIYDKIVSYVQYVL